MEGEMEGERSRDGGGEQAAESTPVTEQPQAATSSSDTPTQVGCAKVNITSVTVMNYV